MKTKRYNHQRVERKWQKRWEQAGFDRAVDFDPRPKFYGLVEFPYPSGEGLHVGHPRPFTAMDIICRQRRMAGVNVLFPIGFDAFGLPAENYAIKTKTHPAVTTAKNIKTFTRQLKSLGFSFDWSRAFSTTEPEYYRWTQWIFLQLYRRGLAYRAEIPINWCERCKIGLANEEVVDAKCERCGGPVTIRTKAQWILKITAYADRLADDLAVVDYPERVKQSQLHWIGKSEGATVQFSVPSAQRSVAVFTTRPDTIFGATFLVVAPEHTLIANCELRIANCADVKKYIAEAKMKTDIERTAVNREKTGIKIEGVEAINPATGKIIPIFVADYVVSSYGTGAIMAVPAHDQRDFEFAKKYHLPIIEVVAPAEKIRNPQSAIRNSAIASAYEATEGVLMNSGQFNNLSVAEGAKKIIAWLEYRGSAKSAVSYKLRDWVFSRQRYWGEPIPLIYCHSDECRNRRLASGQNEPGVHAVVLDGREHTVVAVPEEALPVMLPKVKHYQPTATGESPLAAVRAWVNTRCPQCGSPARRETDVMPNWAGSNWYFLRYCDPKNDQVLADPKKLLYWMGSTPPSPPLLKGGKKGGLVGGLVLRSSESVGGVDWYNGGMEHTTLHLLYSRFIYKFLWDIGAVPKACGPEPYQKRTSHGLILGAGGAKMSKSRGNVVNPDAIVAAYGADVLRLYEMFIGPFDQPAPWDTRGIVGMRRFVDSLAGYVTAWQEPSTGGEDADLERLLQQTIRKVGKDIERMGFNTAIAQLMIFRNAIVGRPPIARRQLETLLVLVAPFAPHLGEELWEQMAHRSCPPEHRGSIFSQPWPLEDAARAQATTATVVVQVDGKVRDRLSVSADSSEAAVVLAAAEQPNVQRYLAGKTVVRTVYVAKRLVNFVTNGE